MIYCVDRGIKWWYNFCTETTIRVMGQEARQLRMDNRLTLEESAV